MQAFFPFAAPSAGPVVCCDDDECADLDPCLDEACQCFYQHCSDADCAEDTMPAAQCDLQCDELQCDFDCSANPPVSDSDKEAAAAAALASFTESQLAFARDGFSHVHSNSHPHPHQHSQPHPRSNTAVSVSGPGDLAYMGLSSLPDSAFQLDDTFDMSTARDLPNQFSHLSPESVLAAHILQFHSPGSNQTHFRPCLADYPGLAPSKCTLPKYTAGDAMAQQMEENVCGFHVQNPDQFAYHLFAEHRSVSAHYAAQFNLPLSFHPSHGFATDVSELSSDMSLSPFQMDTSQTDGQQFSTPASSFAATPTSLATTPILAAETYPTDSSSAGRTESPLALISVKQELETEEEFVCHWASACGNTICACKFNDARDLHTHVRSEHLKSMGKDTAGGFHCSWNGCSRSNAFTQKSKLERHLQTHTGFKPVQCTICGLQLSAKQSLDQHMRTHTGEKPWKCDHPGCNHAFKQQSALTMHQRTHTGFKPLRCEICNKTFGESSNLSKHRRTHNTKGIHVCTICNKDFNRLDQLRRHMNTNHKDRPEEVAMFLRQIKGSTGRISRQRAAGAVPVSQGLNDDSMEYFNNELSEELV